MNEKLLTLSFKPTVDDHYDVYLGNGYCLFSGLYIPRQEMLNAEASNIDIPKQGLIDLDTLEKVSKVLKEYKS